MNSVQEIIRQKLAFAIEDEKRRVAASLWIEAIQQQPGQPGQPRPSDPAVVANKRARKAQQIQDLRQRISDMQSKAPQAKDPTAMRDKLQLLKTKLSAAQQEMSQIK